MRLRILAQAESEGLKAAGWYERERPGLGNEFLDALDRAVETIVRQPRLFPQLETLRTLREVRRFVLQRFPFTIIYEIMGDEILVLAVAHARRRPNYWKRRQ